MHFLRYLLFFLSASLFSAEVVDDKGTKVFLEKSAKRIVSLSPDLTEILYAIGAGPLLVGVISGSDYPKEALMLPKVGNYLALDMEGLLALSPDLIVTWGDNFTRQLKIIKKWGIPIYSSSPKALEDIPRTMLNLGQLAGEMEQSKKVASEFRQKLSFLAHTYRNQQAISVFFQIGSYTLLTINKDSWINQVIELCGGRNIFAQAKTLTPAVSWEALLSQNPEVAFNATLNDSWRETWQKWPQIRAVKQNRLWRIPPDWILRPGPRLLKGAEYLCLNLQSARA